MPSIFLLWWLSYRSSIFILHALHLNILYTEGISQTHSLLRCWCNMDRSSYKWWFSCRSCISIPHAFISIAFMSQSITKWRLPLIWRSRQIPKWQSLIHCILYFILFTSFIDFYGDYGVDDEGEEASTIISWILLHIKLYVGYYKQLLRDDDDVFHHLTKNMIDCNSNGEAPVFTLFSKWNNQMHDRKKNVRVDWSCMTYNNRTYYPISKLIIS